MAGIWLTLSKLIQCVEKLFGLTKTSKKFCLKNCPIKYRFLKPLLIVSYFCGIIGAEKREEKNADSEAEEVLHNVALATLALKDGDIEKSEKMLMKTLNLAENKNFPLAVISTCDLLSSLSMKLGDYEKAEDFLIRALDNLLRQGAPEDDSFVVSFNLKLSRIYSNNGNNDLAELGFKNCLLVQKKKLKECVDEETYLLWATILYWYGKFLFGRKRYKEAKARFQECYLTSLKLKNLLPSQIMVILYNLGEVCQLLGDYDEAFEHLQQGVSLDKKCRNPDLTYFYTKLGTISMFKGLYTQAKRWCVQGQKLAVKHENSEAEKESKECLEKLDNFLSV